MESWAHTRHPTTWYCAVTRSSLPSGQMIITLLGFLSTGFFGILIHTLYTSTLAKRSTKARQAILKDLGIHTTSNIEFIGFFHPYWYVCPTMDCDTPLTRPVQQCRWWRGTCTLDCCNCNPTRTSKLHLISVHWRRRRNQGTNYRSSQSTFRYFS